MSPTPSPHKQKKTTENIKGLLKNAAKNKSLSFSCIAFSICVYIVIGRYVVGSNRVLLMLKDGSQAWDVKDFLVQQDRCEVVTIEGKDYPGKGSGQVAQLFAERIISC